MTITTTNITIPINSLPIGGHRPLADSGLGASSVMRRRIVASHLRTAALAIWRLLPTVSSPTPSEDAISRLSQSDRLGERR